MFNLGKNFTVLLTALSLFLVGTLVGITVSELVKNNSKDDPAVELLPNQNVDLASYLKVISPRLLNGLNVDKRIAIVSTYEVSKEAKGELTNLLKMSGSKLTADLTLSEKLFNSKNGVVLDSLVKSLTPKGYVLDVNNTVSIGKFAELLSILLCGEANKPPVSLVDKQSAFQAFSKENLLQVNNFIPEQTDLTIFLTGDGRQDNKNLNVLMAKFVQEFRPEINRVILAGGNDSAKLGAVGVVRTNPELNKLVTTVDNFNLYMGQLSTVLAIPSTLNRIYQSIGTDSGAKAITATV